MTRLQVPAAASSLEIDSEDKKFQLKGNMDDDNVRISMTLKIITKYDTD